jgi:uncharacterized membrane protein HdeD (DUF308 family)
MVPRIGNPPHCARNHRPGVHAGGNARQRPRAWLAHFFSGIVEAVHAFHGRRWGGVLLHIAGGALGILIGLLVGTHPVAGALAWTLLFATFLTVIGFFRLAAAIWLRYRSWGWAVLDGIVTLVLGLLLWAGLPWSGLWFLGFALGIALLLRGWSAVIFAFAVRHISNPVLIRRVA